jgi:hypothetical protein
LFSIASFLPASHFTFLLALSSIITGNTCVDKTFGFNDLTGDGKSPVITTHHSSAAIKEGSSLVICQNEGNQGEVPTCS